MENTFEYLMTGCHNFHQNMEFQPHLSNAEFSDEILGDKSSLMPFIKPIKSIANNYITVKSVGKIEFIDYNDVIWLYASENYIEIFLEERSILHRESLTSLENKLKNTHFARVHRSSIINLNKIKSIESDRGRFNSITLISGHSVKLSNTYRSDLFEQLGIDNSK